MDLLFDDEPLLGEQLILQLLNVRFFLYSKPSGAS